MAALPGIAGNSVTSSPQSFDRFRSFAERYVIERAGSFRPGSELEDAWRTIQDAKRVYGMIAQARDNVDENGAQRGDGTPASEVTTRLLGLAQAYVHKGQPVPKVLEQAIATALTPLTMANLEISHAP